MVLVTVTQCQVVEKCRVDTYPPPENTKLKWVKVDLNVDPTLRWKEALLPVKQEIRDLVSVITGNFLCNKMCLLPCSIQH